MADAAIFVPTARDMQFHKMSGDICDNLDGQPITWSGHLCEGSNLVAPVGQEFCLWTKCGKHDVPSDAAEIGRMEFITCPDCAAIAKATPEAS